MNNTEASNLTSQWQPIETAPKDGPNIQGWADDWIPEMAWSANAWCSWDSMEEYWAPLSKQPTHWQPQPQPPAGGVTISTEKKGGEAGMFIESPPMKGASDVRPEGRPADVPSEGRGELLPFNLSDALAGKPVVTRDGRAADGFTRFKYGQWPVRGSVGLWVMKWTEHGEYYGPDRPDHRDLFMLPTEGSGA